MKAPTKALMTLWIKNAWEGLSREMIEKSFRVCGVTAIDGSQDEEIGVFKEGGVAHDGLVELGRKTKVLLEQEGDLDGLLFKPLENSAVADDPDEDMVVDDNSSGEESDGEVMG